MRVLFLSSIVLTVITATVAAAELVSGKYVEARTCQVYTGPCFANGEVGSVGKDAIMTWSIDAGRFADTELGGKSVAVIVKTSHTMGFKGIEDAETKRAIVIVDSSADAQATDALRKFALAQTGLSNDDVECVYHADIVMEFDTVELTATVDVRDFARLKTRKARKDDCICSNESAYYPPLTKLQGFVPGVTIQGDVSARRLGTRWSIPDSRTAYLGTFRFDATQWQLAQSNL